MHHASAQLGGMKQLCDEQHAPQHAVLACCTYPASDVKLPQAAGLITLSDAICSPQQVHKAAHQQTGDGTSWADLLGQLCNAGHSLQQALLVKPLHVVPVVYLQAGGNALRGRHSRVPIA